MEYTEMFTATISCNMNFKTYPLDSHKCLLDMKSWEGATYRLLLNAPKIFTFAKDGKTEIEGKNSEIRNLKSKNMKSTNLKYQT